MIKLHGETVTIRRRTLTGTDDYKKPVYSWASLGDTEKAVLQHLTMEDTLVERGEFTVEDMRGWFLRTTALLIDDRVLRASGDLFEVKSKDPMMERNAVFQYEVLLKKMAAVT